MMIKGAGSTMIRSVADVAVKGGCCESLNPTVKENVPYCVGVPEITPEFWFNDSPAGNAPLASDQAYGASPPAPARVTR